jgi:hypothetical protein
LVIVIFWAKVSVHAGGQRMISLIFCLAVPLAVPVAPNYAEHVAPILIKHCVVCHRPEEVAPFRCSPMQMPASERILLFKSRRKAGCLRGSQSLITTSFMMRVF